VDAEGAGILIDVNSGSVTQQVLINYFDMIPNVRNEVQNYNCVRRRNEMERQESLRKSCKWRFLFKYFGVVLGLYFFPQKSLDRKTLSYPQS
jgi:hypothetical protein